MSKPIGRKNYGHIPHIPGSRMGPGDHACHDGQRRIATEKVRDKHDRVIVQEKVDGSNVGVAKLNGMIYPLSRAGYLASTSKYEQHWRFGEWVYANQDRFLGLLEDGERVCGEWLMQAHGTRYVLPHEPFVAFDLMREDQRTCFDMFSERVSRFAFVMPRTLSLGGAFSVDQALKEIEQSGHGAIDPVEGAVWRVERNELVDKRRGGERRWVVDFVVKYVRPDKKDGIYLPEVSGKEPVWNWKP